MGRLVPAHGLAVAPAAALLLAALFLLASCSGDGGKKIGGRDGGQGDKGANTGATSTAPRATERGPREVTLGGNPGAEHEVVLRLEGSPKTTFSGLCSVGGQESVLSGRVPKRFAFNPKGAELSCRIEKRDGNQGTLKVILIAGNTTRSVQQTNSPNSTINVLYGGG